MRRFTTFGWRAAWAILSLATLAGCAPLQGLGRALSDAFKGIRLP